MECKDELKEIDIKNCVRYYFDDIMRAWEINIYTNFSDILLDGKFCEEKKQKYFIYGISYKNLTGARPLHIRYNKIDGFIKTRNKIRYLVSII